MGSGHSKFLPSLALSPESDPDGILEEVAADRYRRETVAQYLSSRYSRAWVENGEWIKRW